jgi:hypothetical protein
MLEVEARRAAAIGEARPHGGALWRTAPTAAIRISRLHPFQKPLARCFNMNEAAGTELPKRQRVVGPIHPEVDGPWTAADLDGEFADVHKAFEYRFAFLHCRAFLRRTRP